MRATSDSVVTPGSSSATSFTRHTSFGTSPPSFREPEAYLDREPAPTGLHALPVFERYVARHGLEQRLTFVRGTIPLRTAGAGLVARADRSSRPGKKPRSSATYR